jgi:hypothetical protein
MLTLGQQQEIIRIAKALKANPKEHPSETCRESFASYTQQQIDDTIIALRKIYANNDGFLAFKVIHIDRTKCLASVVGAYVNGELTI